VSTEPHYLTPTPEAWAFAERQARIHGHAEGANRTSFAAGWYAFTAEVAELTAERDRAAAERVAAHTLLLEGRRAHAATRLGIDHACPAPAFRAELERHRPVIEAVRELHKPALTTVEWWHDQTGDGHGYTCPTCRPEEPHTWSLPIGAAGVKPEGWVESYILAPCPTLAAVDALGSAAPTPRTWTLPPEPGLEVTRVVDQFGQYFERHHDEHPGDDEWIGQVFAGDGDVPDLQLEWAMLMAYQAPLTDATPAAPIEAGHQPLATPPAVQVERWHTGRSWTGHEIEDDCPCPKEPCGLVDTGRAVAECLQHPVGRAKSMRQGHRAGACPAAPTEATP